MRKRWIALIAFVAAISAPFVIVYRVKVAERAWAESFGPLDDVPRRFESKMNETAIDLPDRTSILGVPLSFDGRGPSLSLGTPLTSEQFVPIADYLDAQMTSPRAAVPAGGAAARYFRAQSANLDEFGDWLLERPAPTPPLVFDRLNSVPNLLPVMRFQKLLTAAAIDRAARGDHRGAEHLLDASWRLHEEFRNSPLLISQLIAMAVTRFQLGALRKAEVDAAKWLPRLRGHDDRGAMIRSFVGEAYRLDANVRTNLYADAEYLRYERSFMAGMGQELPFRPQWYVMLRTPIRWFDLPAQLEGQRQRLIAARSARLSPRIDEELNAAFKRGFAQWWFLPDRDMEPAELSTVFQRLSRTAAEREMTSKVIAARSAFRAHHDRWPRAIDGFERSEFQGARWIYEVTSRGSAIRMEPEPQWKGLLGTAIPLRYEF